MDKDNAFVPKYRQPANNNSEVENIAKKIAEEAQNGQENNQANAGTAALVKKYENILDDILDKQQKLADSPDKYRGAPERLEKSFKKLLEDVNQEAQNNGDVDISPDVVNRFKEKMEQYKKVKEEKFSGEPQREQMLDEDLKIITRSEKDIRKNLESIAKEVERLPKEHVLSYLNNVIKNSDFEVQSDYLTDGKDVLLENPKLKNDETTEGNINKIYAALVRDENKKIREELDKQLKEKLIADKELKKLLSENKLTEENIRKLFDIIQNDKKVIYTNVLGEEFLELPLKILPPHEDPNVLGTNTGKEVKVFMNTGRGLRDVFETLLHEMVHQDQNSMLYSNNEETGNLPFIYYLNSSPGGYLKESGKYYNTQPVEKEAIESSEKLVKEVLDKILNENERVNEENYADSDRETSDSDSEEEMDFATFVKSQFNKNENTNNIVLKKAGSEKSTERQKSSKL